MLLIVECTKKGKKGLKYTDDDVTYDYQYPKNYNLEEIIHAVTHPSVSSTNLQILKILEGWGLPPSICRLLMIFYFFNVVTLIIFYLKTLHLVNFHSNLSHNLCYDKKK